MADGYKKYKNLIDPLVSYTCDKFHEMTLPKLGLVTLIYEIIRESIADLHHGSDKLKQEAREYFNSVLFDYHCECVAIPKTTMLRIVDNPDKFLTKMNYHGVDDESSVEFSNMP